MFSVNFLGFIIKFYKYNQKSQTQRQRRIQEQLTEQPFKLHNLKHNVYTLINTPKKITLYIRPIKTSIQ